MVRLLESPLPAALVTALPPTSLSLVTSSPTFPLSTLAPIMLMENKLLRLSSAAFLPLEQGPSKALLKPVALGSMQVTALLPPLLPALLTLSPDSMLLSTSLLPAVLLLVLFLMLEAPTTWPARPLRSRPPISVVQLEPTLLLRSTPLTKTFATLRLLSPLQSTSKVRNRDTYGTKHPRALTRPFFIAYFWQPIPRYRLQNGRR